MVKAVMIMPNGEMGTLLDCATYSDLELNRIVMGASHWELLPDDYPVGGIPEGFTVALAGPRPGHPAYEGDESPPPPQEAN